MDWIVRLSKKEYRCELEVACYINKNKYNI